MKATIIDKLIERAKRTPFHHLDGYMERWWLVPYANVDKVGCEAVKFWKRPVSWMLQRFGVAIRLHNILRSDDDRAFHDHPWPYLTIILRGGYFEIKPQYDSSGLYVGNSRTWYGPGSIILRPAKSWHRLELPAGETCWTFFVTGRWRQNWGFMPNPAFKTYWREYSQDFRVDEQAQEDAATGLFKVGALLRYGSGSTALMQVEYVSLGHGVDVARYYGMHCMGGHVGAYHKDVQPATAGDTLVWEQCSCYRKGTTPLGRGAVGFVEGG